MSEDTSQKDEGNCSTCSFIEVAMKEKDNWWDSIIEWDANVFMNEKSMYGRM